MPDEDTKKAWKKMLWTKTTDKTAGRGRKNLGWGIGVSAIALATVLSGCGSSGGSGPDWLSDEQGGAKASSESSAGAGPDTPEIDFDADWKKLSFDKAMGKSTIKEVDGTETKYPDHPSWSLSSSGGQEVEVISRRPSGSGGYVGRVDVVGEVDLSEFSDVEIEDYGVPEPAWYDVARQSFNSRNNYFGSSVRYMLYEGKGDYEGHYLTQVRLYEPGDTQDSKLDFVVDVTDPENPELIDNAKLDEIGDLVELGNFETDEELERELYGFNEAKWASQGGYGNGDGRPIVLGTELDERYWDESVTGLTRADDGTWLLDHGVIGGVVVSSDLDEDENHVKTYKLLMHPDEPKAYVVRAVSMWEKEKD